ncbi:MAG: phosphatase PAP2 family protein [Hyphomicrobiales bacterium]|nr:MAG: phosphatase PAP2 family protein [Hyphomicrobiales bacterium]
MVDLTRSWPWGLGEKRWWLAFLVMLALVGLALVVDRPLSLWAQSWPDAVRVPLREITRYGESDWILYPSAVLFLITGALALLVRWKLMRTMLWQFTALYGFIFTGVGLPSLATTIAKRVIGRARPMHFDEYGSLAFQPNWLDWTFQSFPSGHSTTAFALAAVVGFLSARWFYPALALAVVIGISRVALGVHHPSDVVAGAIVGLLGAYVIRWLFARRGWVFTRLADGGIAMRPVASLRRYFILKRRGIAPAPRQDQP